MINVKEVFKKYDIPVNKIYWSQYDYEAVIFSKELAIKVLSELVSKADEKVEIYHKILNVDTRYENKIVDTLKANSKIKIIYHSNWDQYRKDLDDVKKLFCDDNLDRIDLRALTYSVPNYHHKEMLIDKNVFVFGSWNFLTNTALYDENSDERSNDFDFLENVCFWFNEAKKERVDSNENVDGMGK